MPPGWVMEHEAGYGDRWDAERRAVHQTWEPEVARGRHVAGEPYVVLLGDPDHPQVLLEINGRSDQLTAWRLDEHRRRDMLFEFQILSRGWMTLVRMAEWRYPDAERPEFDATAPRCLTTLTRPGAPATDARGAAGAVFRTFTGHEPNIRRPDFGDWSRLVITVLALPERHPVFTATPRDDGSGPSRPEPAALARSRELPDWPAGATRPGPEIVTMFGPSMRYVLPDGGEAVVEARPAGELRMTSGRLVLTDPGYLSAGPVPFTARLPLGNHPVTVAVARITSNKLWHRVAGCLIRASSEPAATWEPAMSPGDELHTLGNDEFFAAGVDSGVLCFFDADALTEVVDLDDQLEFLAEDTRRHHTARLEHPRTSTTLVGFTSGWGDGAYPAWIGRGIDGDVVAVVADTLVLSDATPAESGDDDGERPSTPDA